MALVLGDLIRMGTSQNRSFWAYRSTGDTLGTIKGSGYFNGAADLLAVGDWIFAQGSASAQPLIVDTNSGGTVTTDAADGT